MSFVNSQTYDEKYLLTICTMTRNAQAELYLKYGEGNTFTGVLKVDGNDRPVFGWVITKKSEGGQFAYNTISLSFQVKLNADFQHQQLFKGIFNYDKTIISGEYFYWGNEFPFQGEKTYLSTTTNKVVTTENVKIFPNPVKDILIIEDLSSNCKSIEIFDINGVKVLETVYANQISVINLNTGIYFLKLINSNNSITTYKFIKE
jgi:hypothetical protein